MHECTGTHHLAVHEASVLRRAQNQLV